MLYTKYYKNMSINAEVSKKVIFSSMEEFWNYLKTRNQIKIKSSEFVSFYDHIYLSKYGCACNYDENYNFSIEIYRQFNKLNDDIWDVVKQDIGCTNIIFKLNDEDLFEL